jgi:PAS domain S-box-containing protein
VQPPRAAAESTFRVTSATRARRDDAAERRVLVLARDGRLRSLCMTVCEEVVVPYETCADLQTLVGELTNGAAALVLTDEVIASSHLHLLTEALRYQGAWSDLPIVLLAKSSRDEASTARAVALLGNVAVLERPIRASALIGVLRTAIRARERQYALREQMEALRRSEERFELATQVTHDAMWDLHCAVDARGRRIIKRAAFGWARAEHEFGMDVWAQRMHPDDRERVVASLYRALDGDDTLWTAEYRFRQADGGYLDILDRGQILRGPDGRAVRAVGAMSDVTDRRRAEQTRALYAAIVLSSDDAIVSKTLDGTIRSWNPGAERLFGYKAEEALGQPIWIIIPPDKMDEEREILERLARGERIEHFETRRVSKDGTLRDISLTVSPLIDSDGRVLGASKVARDITARKRADEELRRQDSQLRLLWDSAAVMLTTDRPDAMLRGVFEKIAPSFGLDAYLSYLADESQQELTLESWAGIRADDAADLRRLKFGTGLCGKVAAERRPIAAANVQSSDDPAFRLVKRFGFRAYAGNPLIVDGRLLGTLSFGTRAKDAFTPDELEFLETICRYMTAAYERVSLIGRMRESDHRKDQFLATLAHELRNPLAPIRNALEIMRVNGRDRSAVEQTARTMIERQLDHMVRLVDDLLDVSRITRGRLQLRKERIDLAGVIKTAVETSRPWIESARHELTVEIPKGAILLDADAVRLAQVFANLLNNAARYTEPGGRVFVTVERGDGAVAVEVRDTGIGIPAEALPRIFDMFAQANASLERAQSGLGVGLTLVKQLVEMHGGSVEARSRGLGHGSSFIVTLPIAAAARPAPVLQREAAPLNGYAGPHRILVADDNPDSAESMSMLLRLMGNDVRTVNDGVAAVEQAAEFRPDVILMDIGMPRLDGYEAARRIREQPWSRGTMLVALTGWGQDEDKRKAIEAGFDRHFTKPLDPAELRKLIVEFRSD